MRIVAIDPSLTGTGLAATTTANPAATFTETITTGLRGHARLDRILREIHNWTRIADLAVIEGPAYGSAAMRQQGHHERAGLWWLITHDLLWRNHVPYVVVDPTSRMRYATGKARADKDAVLAATIRRYPAVDVANNNEADALLLAAMAVDHYGHPLVVVPQTHRAALDKVTWPELPVEPKRGVA